MRLPLAAFDPLIVRGKEFAYWRELQRRPWNPEKCQLVLDRSPDFVIAGQVLGINVERYEDFSPCSQRTTGSRVHVIGDRIARRESDERRPEWLGSIRQQSMHVGGEPVSLAGVIGRRPRLAPVSRQVAPAIRLRRLIRPHRLYVLERLRMLLRYREQSTRCVGDQIGWVEPVELLRPIPLLDLKLKRIRVQRCPGGGT